MPEVGFVLGSSFHTSDLADVARALESSGFRSVWVTEDYFATGGIAGATVILGATSALQVGTGLLSAYARHPALTAMEAATLSSAYPGRFRLGVGAGGLGWLDQQGITHASPLSAVRGNVEVLRRLLSGEEVSGDVGGFHHDRVRLEFPPPEPPPIFIGATGPKMTALAGEVADGLLLSVFSTPEFVGSQRSIIDAASARGPTPRLTTFAFLALSDSPVDARAALRPLLAAYLTDGESAVMTDAIGITDDLRALVDQGGPELLARDMPDSWIDQLAVCGDLQACLARIQALGDAGSDEVALAPIHMDSLTTGIEALGRALQLGRPRSDQRSTADSASADNDGNETCDR